VPNFAVNLPAPVGENVGGALGFVFGSAGGALQLNLRLSAAETEGTIKTISAPRVTTLDNNTARISQGVSIPFSQTSAAGVNTTFVEARLSLEVTPHITQDGSILMAINASNNQPDPANTGANGQPSIQRKEAVTQVLVKDGDTTVIGGIYVRRGSTRTNSVPFLSKIPVLGFFFRQTNDTDERQELLIFITPRILNRQTIAQSL
jgi:type IV pilus assembly protein PilQ